MNQIHMLHGCALDWHSTAQSMRNYVSEKSLRRHLETRSTPYGALSRFPDCDVLTIDDSTVGAARACVIAREARHEVTLFINPAQIARRRPYWFSRLDAILDRRAVQSLKFDGHEYDLRVGRSLRSFRLMAKAHLMVVDESETDALLDELSLHLGVPGGATIPEHAQTLSLEAIRDLVVRGVHIENHGWDHRDIASLKPDDLIADLGRATDWFRTILGIWPTNYAVPYGLTPLPTWAAQEIAGMVMLANHQWDLGHISGPHWNRRDITRDLQIGIP